MTPLRIDLFRTLPTRQLRTRLGVFVLFDEGKAIRLELNRRAMESYERQNDLETYFEFMNRHTVQFEINGFQCQNFPYYYTMFSVISQHVRGDCTEECLDIAIEWEKQGGQR